MAIFLITRTGSVDYEEYRAFVIKAQDEDEARQIASETNGTEGRGQWLNPSFSKCEELKEDGVSEIICSDFNAG